MLSGHSGAAPVVQGRKWPAFLKGFYCSQTGELEYAGSIAEIPLNCNIIKGICKSKH